jgi:TPR repeat protein
VNEDYEMALVHFQAAADRGYTTAQLIVAHFYAYGLTGPAKIDLALRYANLALLQDRVKASEKIAEYEQLLADQASGKERPIMRQPLNTVPSPTASSIMEPPPLPPEPTAVNIQPRDPVFKPTVNRLPSIYENIGSTEPPPPPDIPSSPQTGLSPEEIPPPAPNRLPPSGISNSNADLEMAKKHYFGLGVPIDIDRAYSLFSRSANRGNPESARYLGIMYLRGKGVQKDTNKALEWFTRAAQGGDELAKKNLKTLQILGN